MDERWGCAIHSKSSYVHLENGLFQWKNRGFPPDCLKMPYNRSKKVQQKLLFSELKASWANTTLWKILNPVFPFESHSFRDLLFSPSSGLSVPHYNSSEKKPEKRIFLFTYFLPCLLFYTCILFFSSSWLGRARDFWVLSSYPIYSRNNGSIWLVESFTFL